jgi:TolB-like protein/Flp pilus assembly protein TadD
MNKNENQQGIEEKTTVFFSYSRVDKKHARPIISAIEKAGYKVWWDGMLEGGTSYLETTEEALESAKAVVVLWSENSVKSHWVRDEAMSGRTRERLLPISLDGTIPPLGFRQVQLIDFTDWRQDPNSAEFEELRRSMAQFHGREDNIVSPSTLQRAKRPLSRRAVLLGSGGIILGTAAGLAISDRLANKSEILANSLIVLPFENLMGDEQASYIASGVSSEIRSQLARNKSLKVLAKSSSNSVSAEEMSAQDVSKTLGVAYLLEGSVNRLSDKLDFSVDLTEGQTGFNLWSENYSTPSSEILFVKDSITRSVLEVLSKVVDKDKVDIELGDTRDPAAFDAYLRGLSLFEAFESIESLELALSYLNQATKLDPEFGKAMVVKAQLLLSLASYTGDIDISQSYKDLALKTALNAVLVVPALAESHSALGFIRMGLLDIAGAEQPYLQSNELDGGGSAVQARFGLYMMVTGDHSKALTAINKAIDIDPLNETMHSSAGLIHYAAGRYDDSIKSYERVLELAPGFFNAHAQIGLSMIRKGQLAQGIARCEMERNNMERLTCLAIGFHKTGQTKRAEKAHEELIKIFGDNAAYQQLQILAEWGQESAAMDMLKKSVDLKDSGLTLALFDPALDSLRHKKDFRDLLAQIGFKP